MRMADRVGDVGRQMEQSPMAHTSQASRIPFTALAILALAGSVLTVAPSIVEAQGGAASAVQTRIGLINIETLINSLEELKIGQAQIKVKADARQKELTDLSAQIEDLNKQLELMKMDDPARRDKAAKITELAATATAKQNAYQAIINIEKGDLLKDMHSRIMAAASDYASKNNLDLVLMDDRALTFGENLQENVVSGLIAQKRVLHAAPAMDITPAILTKMNNEFLAGNGKKKR